MSAVGNVHLEHGSGLADMMKPFHIINVKLVLVQQVTSVIHTEQHWLKDMKHCIRVLPQLSFVHITNRVSKKNYILIVLASKTCITFQPPPHIYIRILQFIVTFSHHMHRYHLIRTMYFN